MADTHLICNNPKCRKRLTNAAWISSCSHVFCDEDANNTFLNNSQDDIVCPACKTSLPDKHDIVRADLNPSEKFKSVSKNIIMLIFHTFVLQWGITFLRLCINAHPVL